MIARSKAEKHVAENYSFLDVEVGETNYNFKNGSYYTRYKSKTSIDTYFSVEYANGKIWDSYESVTNGWNTYARLDLEFSKEIDRIMKEELPYEINMVVASLISKDNFENFDIPLDAKLDMTKPYGIPTLSVYVYDNNISWEDVAKLALKSKEIMEKHNIPIEEYSCQISPTTTGEQSKDWNE